MIMFGKSPWHWALKDRLEEGEEENKESDLCGGACDVVITGASGRDLNALEGRQHGNVKYIQRQTE
jgi:hypothetical protein